MAWDGETERTWELLQARLSISCHCGLAILVCVIESRAIKRWEGVDRTLSSRPRGRHDLEMPERLLNSASPHKNQKLNNILITSSKIEKRCETDNTVKDNTYYYCVSDTLITVYDCVKVSWRSLMNCPLSHCVYGPCWKRLLFQWTPRPDLRARGQTNEDEDGEGLPPKETRTEGTTCILKSKSNTVSQRSRESVDWIIQPVTWKTSHHIRLWSTEKQWHGSLGSHTIIGSCLCHHVTHLSLIKGVTWSY